MAEHQNEANTVGNQSFVQGAQNVTFNGGNFHVGNIIQEQEKQEKAKADILSMLERVTDYGNIHSANLGRATEGTGPKLDEWTEFRGWLTGKEWFKAMWGTGMRESKPSSSIA